MKTLAELAASLHVSVSTVSRALNPRTAHLISPPVRGRIQSLAARSGFVPNRTAQELVRGRSQTIGIVVSTEFDSLFFNEHLAKTLAGIHTELRAAGSYGSKLVVLPRGESVSELDSLILQTRVDGLLLATLCDFSARELRQLAERLRERSKRPVVLLNLPAVKGSRVGTVSFDNKEGAREIVSHLIRTGHRRIGLIYAENDSVDARDRVEGYKRALEDHHLRVTPELSARGEFSPASGYDAALKLLRKNGPRPDAIFCLNDEMAIGALRAIQALRLRCPQDVAVAGFDGLQIGELLEPRLTTVVQPTFEIARAGTRLLIDWIEGRPRAQAQMTLPMKLLVRDSA